jgi:hypothetical protein
MLMKFSRITQVFTALFFVFTVLIIGGCASTYQARSVEESGFLGDYSMLKEGTWSQALLVYINPNANELCKNYTKVLLEPVSIWVKAESSLEDVSEEDRQMLTDYLYNSLKEALSKDYIIADRAGPGVLRVRAALTEAEGSWVVLDTITSIVPIALGLSTLKQLAFGTASFVADASIELELEDSMSEMRLAARVDRRGGGKGWSKKFNKWGKVEKAFDHWAEKLQKGLATCRAGELEI